MVVIQLLCPSRLSTSCMVMGRSIIGCYCRNVFRFGMLRSEDQHFHFGIARTRPMFMWQWWHCCCSWCWIGGFLVGIATTILWSSSKYDGWSCGCWDRPEHWTNRWLALWLHCLHFGDYWQNDAMMIIPQPPLLHLPRLIFVERYSPLLLWLTTSNVRHVPSYFKDQRIDLLHSLGFWNPTTSIRNRYSKRWKDDTT